MKIRTIFRAFLAGLLTVSCLEVMPIRVEAAPGDYDTSFGSGGFAEFEMPDGTNDLCCVRQQPDGKLLVAWHSYNQNSLSLRRHNQDGSIDTSFGYNGAAVKELTSGTPLYVKGRPNAVIVLPDGRIVVVGQKRLIDRDGNDYYRAAVWSFTAEGVADPGFTGDGEKLLLDSAAVQFSEAIDVERAPGGKIYVVYRNHSSSGYESVLTRLNDDGSYDAAFGNSGKVMRSGVVGNQIAVDSARRGGRIYWAGTAGNPFRLAVRRYSSSGALATDYGTFGSAGLGGTCFESLGSTSPNNLSLELQPDGKLVVGGSAWPPTPFVPEPFIARFNSNGSIDSSFSNDGIVGCPRSDGFLTALKIQSDNRIVMINGTLSLIGAWAFQRFLTNGQMDTGFVPAGPPNDKDFGTDLLIQSEDDKIVTLAPSFPGYRLSRYLP